MNKKYFSVLFSALLASTFVHELRAKCVIIPPIDGPTTTSTSSTSTTTPSPCLPPPSSSSPSPPPSSSPSVPVNRTICTSTSNSSLVLVVVTETIIVIGNLTASVFLSLDVRERVVALFDGNKGTLVVIDLQANVGVFFRRDSSCGCTWDKNNQDLVTFAKGVVDLRALLSGSGGRSFSVNSANSEVLSAINAVMVSLVVSLAIEVGSNAKAGLTLLISIATQLVVALNGTLSGLLQFIGIVVIRLYGDLSYFLNVVLGLSAIFKIASDGGLRDLIAANILIDFGVVFGSGSGTDILIYIFACLSAVIDVGQRFGSISIDAFLIIIVQLGGNVSVGVTGLLKVVAYILIFIAQRIRLEILISIIIQFVVEASRVGRPIDFRADIQAIIVLLISINSTAFAKIIVFLRAIVAGNCTVGNVNISLIITKLIQGVTGGVVGLLLVVVINVLILLTAVVQLVVSIPTLLFVLIINLNCPCGVRYLQILGINLGISITGIVGSILKAVIGTAISLVLLLTGNIVGFLKSIGVIGRIIIALDTACKQSDQPSINLNGLLIAAGGILQLILGLLQLVVGLVLGVAASVIATVTVILQAVGSVTFYANVYVSFGASTSVSG